MRKLAYIFILSIFIIASCNKDNDDNTKESASPTKVLVYMHDVPDDYQQVNVDIREIKIKGNGSDEEFDLEENAGVYDLLDYQNGLDTLIGEITVNFDTISQIRLILGPDNSVMVDSVIHPMLTPSAQQSGLKINVHGELTYVDTFTIVLDFDASESVHKLGNGTYQLHPVIHLDDK